MLRIEPSPPSLLNPRTFRRARRIARTDDAAFLPWLGRSVPADNVKVLALGELRDFIEAFQIVRLTLPAELILLVDARPELNKLLAAAPDALLSVVPIAPAEDFLKAVLNRAKIGP